MRHLILIVLLLATPLSAFAEITVTDAWARATPPAARTAALYLTLVNDGEADDALLGAQTDAADIVEIHSMRHEDGMMLMEQIESMILPAGERAKLAPHGKHLMLIGLRHDLAPGQAIHLRLEFERHPAVTVNVPVRDARRGSVE